MCSRLHEVADDGTFATWVVSWSGTQHSPKEAKHYLSPVREAHLRALEEGFISNGDFWFCHYEDAEMKYGGIKCRLQERGDWHIQQEFLVIRGARMPWSDIEGGVWIV